MADAEGEIRRCGWAADERFWEYHDREWGVPVRDDRLLFEFLVLEGAQAGLSWSTILAKRPAYRKAFRSFEIATVARFAERDVARLLGDAGIVRNEAKIRSAIRNARASLAVIEERGSLASLLWSFVDGAPRQNRWRSHAQVPATSAESDAMSRELKRRGFNFVGSTICYAFMQAVGLVNDHLVACYRHGELKAQARP